MEEVQKDRRSGILRGMPLSDLRSGPKFGAFFPVEAERDY